MSLGRKAEGQFWMGRSFVGVFVSRHRAPGAFLCRGPLVATLQYTTSTKKKGSNRREEMNRIPARKTELPRNVLSQDELSDGENSSSSDDLPPRRPQHHQKHYQNIPLYGERAKYTRQQKQQTPQRSSHLQSVMDGLQLQMEGSSNSSTAERIDQHHEKRGEDDDDDNDNDEYMDQIANVLDMFSTYDVLLEHLIKKNQKLKKYVRNETDIFPSAHTYTTGEVVNTLEQLREERNKNPVQLVSGRKVISQPRPTRVGNSSTWHEIYPQTDCMGRQIGEDEREDSKPSKKHEGRERRFLPPKFIVKDRGPTKAPERQRKSVTDSRLQTQDLLQILKGYKTGRMVSVDDRTMNERTYDEYDRQVEERLVGGRQREILLRSRARPSQTHDRRHHLDDFAAHNATMMIGGRTGGGRPDPIELLRAKNDRDWLYGNGGEGSVPEGRDSTVGFESTKAKTASALLSKLLPEKIPPKIKASRERIAQFRNSRLHTRQNKSRINRNANPNARQLAPSSHQNIASNGYQQHNHARPRYISPRSLRPGSPDRPLNVDGYDDRYQRRRLWSDRLGTHQQRPGSPDRPLIVDGYGSYERMRRGNERVDEYQASGHHFSRQRSVSAGNLGRFSQGRDKMPIRSYLPPAHQTSERFSEFRHRQDSFSSQDASSVTPSEKVRRLRSHLDDLYLQSLKMDESNEQLKEALVEIKHIYHARAESRDDRVRQMRKSTGLEERQHSIDKRGRVYRVTQSGQHRDTLCDKQVGSEKHYDTFREIRPPRHPSTNGDPPPQKVKGRINQGTKVKLLPRFKRDMRKAVPESIIAEDHQGTKAILHPAIGYRNHDPTANERGHRLPYTAFETSLLSTSSDDNSSRPSNKNSRFQHEVVLQNSKPKQALYIDPILSPGGNEQRIWCIHKP